MEIVKDTSDTLGHNFDRFNFPRYSFFEYHDQLFQVVGDWKALGGDRWDVLVKRYGSNLGLSPERFSESKHQAYYPVKRLTYRI
jgi:hypothetical protein